MSLSRRTQRGVSGRVRRIWVPSCPCREGHNAGFRAGSGGFGAVVSLCRRTQRGSAGHPGPSCPCREGHNGGFGPGPGGFGAVVSLCMRTRRGLSFLLGPLCPCAEGHNGPCGRPRHLAAAPAAVPAPRSDSPAPSRPRHPLTVLPPGEPVPLITGHPPWLQCGTARAEGHPLVGRARLGAEVARSLRLPSAPTACPPCLLEAPSLLAARESRGTAAPGGRSTVPTRRAYCDYPAHPPLPPGASFLLAARESRAAGARVAAP